MIKRVFLKQNMCNNNLGLGRGIKHMLLPGGGWGAQLRSIKIKFEDCLNTSIYLFRGFYIENNII